MSHVGLCHAMQRKRKIIPEHSRKMVLSWRERLGRLLLSLHEAMIRVRFNWRHKYHEPDGVCRMRHKLSCRS